MEASIRCMSEEIGKILGPACHSFWLYGSVVLKDFRLGWSDIDFITFSREAISPNQADALLMLRQTLSEKEPDNPYYRLFEGVICSLPEYREGCFTRLVYWGTSGQRITDQWEPDAFSRWELACLGRAVYGEQADRPRLFSPPAREELFQAVRRHYEGIRLHARKTDESLYACGWLLDICRCLYTLQNGAVISKTQAGDWALERHLFANEEPLRKALEIRRNPLVHKDNPEVKAWLASLGPVVQQYADALEEALKESHPAGANLITH
ncbi:MAG: DUF4111 domain-containing protein [Lachnospiraceae bacterium]|nr:DUF4111 domain-containing protein [Lachnospiraceae bacterium]